MKKRLLSTLLILTLSLSLLTVGAFAAEGDPPAEGLYTSIDENNLPTGDAIAKVESNGFSQYIINYDDAAEAAVYYYRPDASGYTWEFGQMLIGEKITDDLYKITVEARSGTFTSSISITNESGGPSFPITFVDTTIDAGLYYKFLRGFNDGVPYVDENDPYLNGPIVLPPFVDRTDIATYYCDGTNYYPVEVVFSDNLAVDHVSVTGEDFFGYIFAAYDFTSGTITGTYDNGTPDDPADDIPTAPIRVETRMPDFAYYTENTVSEENYRMYTLATENSDPGYADYKYAKTLYFMATDESFDFPDIDFNDRDNPLFSVHCEQRQYLPNGNETDAIPYTDFNYMITRAADGKSLTVTIYTNDSDILFFLGGFDGNGNWIYGSYVNILAPDDTNTLVFNMNNQGNYAAAKFLPRHIFDELAALNRDVTLEQDGFPGNVTLDSTIVGSIANENNHVSFCMTTDAATEEEEAAIAAALASGETSLDIIDLTLYFGTEKKHHLDGGTATIQYKTADIPDGTIVKVYYLNDNGELEEMAAEFNNGHFKFTTPHFSKFVLVTAEEAPTPLSPPTPPSPPPAPLYKLNFETNGGSSVSTLYGNYNTTFDPSAYTPEKDGYIFGGWYKDAELTEMVESVTLTRNTTVYAKWIWINVYTDIAKIDWYYDAVACVTGNSLMNGTGDNKFSPDGNMTRAMMWTILARMKGVDLTGGATWYENARNWAISAGVSDGTNPDDYITRQQLVTMLWRYVGEPDSTGILNSYADADKVSLWATQAMCWAVENGVVSGYNGYLSPGSNATRAHAAQILTNYMEK